LQNTLSFHHHKLQLLEWTITFVFPCKEAAKPYPILQLLRMRYWK